jgi:hypothetical protein
MSNRPYAVDRRMSDEYIPQMKSILKVLLPYWVEITIAPVEQDNQYATDLLVNGTIAARVRDTATCKYLADPKKRDLTLRVHRDTAKKTELEKIIEGYASHYFYSWADKNHNIIEWIFVDLDKLRTSGLLDKERRWIPNGDGTYFVAISKEELYEAKCIIANHLTNLRVASIIPDKHEWNTLSFVPRHRMSAKNGDKYNGSLWQPTQQQDLWEALA